VDTLHNTSNNTYQNQDGDPGHYELLSTSCQHVLKLWIVLEQSLVNGTVNMQPCAEHPDDGGCDIEKTPSLELGQERRLVYDSSESIVLSHPLKYRHLIMIFEEEKLNYTVMSIVMVCYCI
jgi:hypothetical protein